MKLSSTIPFLVAGLALGAAAPAGAETVTKQGVNAAGQPCAVMVNRNRDGSLTAAGAGGGTVTSSSSAGGSSVQVQAGGGSVSSTTSMPGGSSASSSAATISINGCTISTASP